MPVLHALGTSLDVDLSATGLDVAEFGRLWSRCVGSGRAQRAEGAEHQLTLLRGVSMEAATQDITRALIEANRGRLLMLHAGAVAHLETGRSLVYVAPGGTGKSTLTRVLGREFAYLTDETVGIDPHTLAIHPYPKPVTLAPAVGRRKEERAPDDLGLQPAHEAPSVGHIVLLRRTANRATADFTDLPVIEAITMITPESSSISELYRPLHTLAGMHARVGCTLVEYGDTSQIVDWCRGRLEGG